MPERHVLAVALGLALSTVAQQPKAPIPRSVERWVDLTEQHDPGALDGAVREVGQWTEEELRGVIKALRSMASDDLRRIVARGLILHTDTAIAYRRQGGYALPGGDADTAIVADGREIGGGSRTHHWNAGRELLAALPGGAIRLDLSRQWYRAAAALLQEWGEFPELSGHLASGLAEVGNDPVLLMYEATLHQAYATPLVQQFFRDAPRSSGPDLSFASPGSGLVPMPAISGATRPSSGRPEPARAELRLAERALRRALEEDAGLVEARLRLGHVLADGGEHDEARRELQHVVPVELPPRLEFYARMLIGREAIYRGELEDAERAFDRALELFPTAQSALMGRSHVAVVHGDSDLALAVLLPPLSGPASAIDDPWMQLTRIHTPSAATLLDEMRADFR